MLIQKQDEIVAINKKFYKFYFSYFLPVLLYYMNNYVLLLDCYKFINLD